MKVSWPFGVAVWAEAPNHPELRWLMTVVVSVGEKAPVRRQVGIRKTIAVDASLLNQVASEPGVTFWPGMSLAGVPLIG